MSTTQHDIDHVTGIATTGHEWDGIKELNKPLPRWWVWVLYVTIIWSIGYWIAYPAWPTLSGYTQGMLGYSQRQRVMDEVAAGKAGQAELVEKIKLASLADIAKTPDLLNFAVAGGRAAFGDNCAGCHGRGAAGAKGFPNLNDDDWLWGGTLDDIHTTLEVGIRSTHPDTRQNQMPRFGIDGLLEPAQINDVAEFVISLSDKASDVAAAERGKVIFAEQCAACHGEDAKGKLDMGSPNLTDKIWLYGGTKEAILETLRAGRNGVMPAWSGRLDPTTIKQLAVYVHSLGGGK
jgi:cytochrome c oxidase cbb3-type subunit 3